MARSSVRQIDGAVEGAVSMREDGLRFTAGSASLPTGLVREIPLNKRFDMVRNALVEQLQGNLLEENELPQGPAPARRYQIEGQRGTAHLQVYMVGGWMLLAIVESKTNDDVNSKDAEAFFASFRLTEQGKSAVGGSRAKK